MNIPDFMPRLRKGAGNSAKDGGCLIQVAGYLYDGVSWTDETPCVHPMLRAAGIFVNDTVSDAARQELLELVPRLIGTGGDTDRSVECKLMKWLIRHPMAGRNLDYAYSAWRTQRDGFFIVPESPATNPDYVAGQVVVHLMHDIMRKLQEEYHGGGLPVSFNGFSMEVWQGRLLGGELYGQAIDDTCVKFLRDILDEYDRITGREESGKAKVTDEDWKRVAEHMKAGV